MQEGPRGRDLRHGRPLQYALRSNESEGLMLHRARGLLVRRRTTTACAIRARFAEFAIIVEQGRHVAGFAG